MISLNMFRKNVVCKKKHVTPWSLTHERLAWMNFGGANPKKQTRFQKSLSYFYMIGSGTIAFLMMPEIILSHHTVGSLAEDFLMGFGFLQMFAKALVCHVKAEKLSEMLDIIWYQFWPIDGLDEKTQKRYTSYYKLADRASKIYSFNVIFAGTAFVISATLKEPYSLVMDIWLPNRDILKTSPFFEIVYVIENYLLYSVCLFSLIPLDSLFVLMVSFVYVQFKLIKGKLRNISGKENEYKVIAKCVQHHNLLLNFIEKMENVYSMINLLSVGSNLMLTTLSLYAVVKETKWSRRFSFLCVYISVFSQLSFYCIAGQFIQTESSTIADAAYESEWYNCNDLRVPKGLLMIIRQSQRTAGITMGGYVNLCFNTLTNYVRATYTFLTFILNVRHS